MLKFTAPIPPSTNEYLAKSVAYAGGRPYVRVYKTSKAIAYEKYMVNLLNRVSKEQGWEVPNKNDYIDMHLIFYMNKLGRDIDNTYKLLIDSLANAGLIINDDKVIPKPINIYIDKDNPRIEVQLVVSDKVGVFKSEKEYNLFLKDNCEGCKRYKRNCGILKRALENRIQTEVDLDDLICFKRT